MSRKFNAAFMLAAIAMLILAACGGGETPTPTTKPTEVPTEVPTEEATVEATSETVMEATPEVTMEATQEVTPEMTMEATEEATPEATMEATEEVAMAPTQEVTPEAMMEATQEATPEVMMEATQEATPEAMVEATQEVTPEATMEATEEAAAMPAGTVLEVALSNPDLSTLVEALQAAGLVQTLDGDGPFTIFAPSDAAFESLPNGLLDTVMANKAALNNLLLYHVVEGNLSAEQVASMTQITTMHGTDVTITVKNGDVYVNDAKIVTKDIQASNGVIHIIDKVLFPKPAQ